MKNLIPVIVETIKKEGFIASLAESKNKLEIIVIPSPYHYPPHYSEENINITYEVSIEKISEDKYDVDILAKFKWKNKKSKEKFPYNDATLLNTLNETLNLVYYALNLEEFPENQERYEEIENTGEIILNQKETEKFIQSLLEEFASPYYNEKVLEDMLQAENSIF